MKAHLDIELDSRVAQAVENIFKANAPTRSGVLKGQVRFVMVDGGFDMISDIYYMPYTNEEWISPRWRGRKNPNEQWWEKAFNQTLSFLSSIYGKEFKRES